MYDAIPACLHAAVARLESPWKNKPLFSHSYQSQMVQFRSRIHAEPDFAIHFGKQHFNKSLLKTLDTVNPEQSTFMEHCDDVCRKQRRLPPGTLYGAMRFRICACLFCCARHSMTHTPQSLLALHRRCTASSAAVQPYRTACARLNAAPTQVRRCHAIHGHHVHYQIIPCFAT